LFICFDGFSWFDPACVTTSLDYPLNKYCFWIYPCFLCVDRDTLSVWYISLWRYFWCKTTERLWQWNL